MQCAAPQPMAWPDSPPPPSPHGLRCGHVKAAGSGSGVDATGGGINTGEGRLPPSHFPKYAPPPLPNRPGTGNVAPPPSPKPDTEALCQTALLQNPNKCALNGQGEGGGGAAPETAGQMGSEKGALTRPLIGHQLKAPHMSFGGVFKGVFSLH